MNLRPSGNAAVATPTAIPVSRDCINDDVTARRQSAQPQT